MRANVDEGFKASVLLSCDKNWNAGIVEGEIISGIRRYAAGSNKLREVQKQLDFFALKLFRVGVLIDVNFHHAIA